MSKKLTKRYLRGAADHWRDAVRLQQERLESDTPDSRSRIDLNFYAVAVTRLCNIASRAINFPGSDGVRDALDQFESRWPQLRTLRNEEEHMRGPKSRGWYYFPRDVVELGPGGKVTYLLDSEDMEPGVEALYQALCELLGDP